MPTQLSRCPDCKVLHEGVGPCPDHVKERNRKRGSATKRGYGYAHQMARKEWTSLVEQGMIDCRRCGNRIEPYTRWDLGHPDRDCEKPTAPEHEACNRATAGRSR